MVTPYSSIKGRSSASAENYVVPGIRLFFCQQSFTVAGPSIWNSLPPHVRNSLTETIFHSKLKTLQLYLWILMITWFQYALLNFVRMALSRLQL